MLPLCREIPAIVLMSTEIFMVRICQIHKLHLQTTLPEMPLARVSGDDHYYHVINKKAEEEIACAGKSMHLIVSHKKVAILCGFSMYSFGGCCSSSV